MQAVLNGDFPAADWLPQLSLALSAIAFGTHAGLVKQVVLMLVHACGSALQPTGSAHRAEIDAPACLLLLLQHPLEAVQAETWAVLHRLLAADASSASDASTALNLQILLSTQPLMRHIVQTCLPGSSKAHVNMAAQILESIIRAQAPQTRQSAFSSCRHHGEPHNP